MHRMYSYVNGHSRLEGRMNGIAFVHICHSWPLLLKSHLTINVSTATSIFSSLRVFAPLHTSLNSRLARECLSCVALLTSSLWIRIYQCVEFLATVVSWRRRLVTDSAISYRVAMARCPLGWDWLPFTSEHTICAVFLTMHNELINPWWLAV